MVEDLRNGFLGKVFVKGEYLLSAYFFCIYVDNMLEKISLEDYGCRIGVAWRNIQAYADDVAIFCSTAGGLQDLLKNFVEQCE